MYKKTVLLTVNLFSLILFISMLVTVLNDGWLTELDMWISMHTLHLRLSWLTPWVEQITEMNSFLGAALFATLFIVYLFRKRWYAHIAFYVIVTLGATGLFALIKAMVGRVRPEVSVIATEGYSFPSGHTTMATAMAFGFYFVFKDKTHDQAFHIALLTMAIGWSLLIAFTRLYLGVHWFTDVVGGFGLGLWWVSLVRLLWQKERSVTPLR